MPLTIIDPTRASVRTSTAAATRAQRPGSLAGLTIGLLENTKRNAAPLLDRLGDALVREHGAKGVVRRTKRQFALPLPDDAVRDIVDECDVLVIGVGDCGSCSAAAVADGIRLERADLPVAVIVTDAFTTTSQAMAEAKGDAAFPYLITEHPVANLDDAGLDARAVGLVDGVLAQLLAGARA